MPPPVVQCDVCKQMVNKAQTCSTGNGKRACKIHDGVLQKKEELLALEKKSKERLRKQQEAKQKEILNRQEEVRDYAQNRCWACKRKALTKQQLAVKMLVANEKLEIKKVGTNLLDPSYGTHLRNELGLGDGDKLLVTDIYPIKGNEKAVAKLPLMTQNLCRCVQVVSLCQDCRDNLQISATTPDLELPSFEDLAKVGAFYEVFLRPEIREEAMKQVVAETQRN